LPKEEILHIEDPMSDKPLRRSVITMKRDGRRMEGRDTPIEERKDLARITNESNPAGMDLEAAAMALNQVVQSQTQVVKEKKKREPVITFKKEMLVDNKKGLHKLYDEIQKTKYFDKEDLDEVFSHRLALAI
jgi:hypothetical protein